MKLLILACGAGSGQAAAAKALKDEAERQGHTAAVVDPFSRLGRKKPDGDAPAPERKKRRSALSRKVERMTDATPLTAPFLFSGAKFAESFGEEIRSGGYGAILAIHPYAMEAVSALIRHGEKLPPARGVFTDYALPPIFRGTELREYFLPHWVLTEDLAEKGIRRERLNPCGVPAPARLASPMGKDEARNYLVLPREEKILLLFAEGLSEGNAARILDELLPPQGTGPFVTVMTGRESGDRDDLARRYAGDGRIQINLFTERFDV
ncbi:MAG: hypothetical protein J5849_05665 [Clostridia bacterium]|nr:hypothetical protein [Clostridia bacterium]